MEEEEDFILDLFEESLDAGKKEEVIAWEAPAVNRVARVLEEGRRDVTNYDPFTNILVGYLVREGRKGLVGELNGVSQEDRVKILLAAEALAPHRVNPKVSDVESFEDYMGAVGVAFGERLGRMLRLDMEFKGVEEAKAEGVEFVDEIDPLFSGFRAETLIAANVVSNLVGEVEVGSYDELARAAFLNFNGSEGNGVLDVTKVLVEKSLGAADVDLDVDTAVARYQEILVSRFGFTQDLITQLERFQGMTFDFNGMSRMIRTEFEERTGYVPNIGTHYDRRAYERLKGELLELDVKLFKPLPTEPTQHFNSRDWARPHQAMGEGGKRYHRRRSETIEKLPLGTVGHLDGDHDFVPTNKGGYFHLRYRELQKLEEVILEVAGAGGDFRRGDRVKLVNNLGPQSHYDTDEYYYGGTIREMKLGIEGEVITGDDRMVRIEFPRRAWNCHPDELKNLTRTPEKIEDEKDEREELKVVMAEVVSGAEADFERAKENKERLVRDGVDTFRAMGVDDGGIRYFFDQYLDDVAEFGDFMPEGTIFNEIMEIQESMNYGGLRDKVVALVKDRMDVLVKVDDVRDAGEYGKFKEDLVDRVLHGFKDKKGKKTEGFERGEPVMLDEAHGKYPKGTIAIYHADCGDDHHVDFDDGATDVHIDERVIGVAAAYALPKIPTAYEGMKKGVRVKIRKDSEYAHQNDGEGVMVNNFGDEEGGRELWAKVKFDKGRGNNYREKDLEPVDPAKLTGRKLKKYNKAVAAMEELKVGIEEQLGPIIAEAERDHADVNRRLDDLTMKTIDTFRSMGFEDEAIGTMFRENMGDTSYLRERELLDY